MKSKICKIFLSCIIVAVLLVASLLMYFSTEKRLIALIFNSYDGQSSINLGKFHGEKILTVGNPVFVIKLDNENIFIEDRLLHLGISYSKIYTKQGTIHYILFNDGYAYHLYMQNGNISCFNAMAGDQYWFPFIHNIVVYSNYPKTLFYDEINMFGDENFEERIFSSYEDIKIFYSKIDETKWYADDLNSTIYVKSYNWYEYSKEKRLSSGYPYVIKCDNEGMVITFDESEL